MSKPLLRSLMAKIDEVHADIVGIQPSEDRSKALSAESAVVDEEHDDLVRGVFAGLSCAHVLTGDAVYLDLRETLFPQGLSTLSRSYMEEAGHTAMVRAAFTDEQRDLLQTVTVRENDLLSYVDRWLAAGERLGDLEQAKAELANPTPTERGQANRARLQWIRVVHVLIATAELEGLSEEDEAVLLGALRNSEAAADRRATARAGDDAVGAGDAGLDEQPDSTAGEVAGS